MEQCILVCGGRDYDNRKQLFRILDVAHTANPIVLLVHGDAPGADTLAQKWADDRGVCCKVYPADWKKHGRAAGPIRNQQMLESEKVHLVIAFPGGRGTADMVKRAEDRGIPVAKVRRRPPDATEKGAE